MHKYWTQEVGVDSRGYNLLGHAAATVLLILCGYYIDNGPKCSLSEFFNVCYLHLFKHSSTTNHQVSLQFSRLFIQKKGTSFST